MSSPNKHIKVKNMCNKLRNMGFGKSTAVNIKPEEFSQIK
jgi:hypothetical protein